jgi:hypothetical protein
MDIFSNGILQRWIRGRVVNMRGLGCKIFISLIALAGVACSPVKPTATTYKEQLAVGTTQPGPKPGTPQPGTNTPTTPGTGDGTATPAAPTGNAQNGLAILTTTCETAGCHKDSAPQLVKGTMITDTTVSKAVHRGVQPVMTKENINDMNAALANR